MHYLWYTLYLKIPDLIATTKLLWKGLEIPKDRLHSLVTPLSLDIDKNMTSNIASSDISNSAFNAIKKCKYHPILHISWVVNILTFRLFWKLKKILAQIHNLDNKKACQESDIPVKMINDDIDILSFEFIFHNFNNSICDVAFISESKMYMWFQFLKER